ncbi:MAG TPA: anaerobic ribonucleoside-triphosphate reductase [Spirochaetota bacterium]|nr:anaerobic ribonucleoside-triphosphate reductase [Spirochaetota bacterium]HPS85991.1 anaerobic ribonucleoside-triphosphate reductase [Spirochaetota bacterium]
MKKFIIPAEVYSRVSGYFRPVAQWNNGKKEEFADRKMLEFDNNIINELNLKIKNQ